MWKRCWSVVAVGFVACSAPSESQVDASNVDAPEIDATEVDAQPVDAGVDATPRGLLDTSFGNNGYVMLGDDVVISAVAVAADGSVFACGGEHDDFDTLRIVKVTAAGVADPTFDGDGVFVLDTGVQGCAFVQPLADGRIAFATAGQPRVRFLSANGSYDPVDDLVPPSINGQQSRFVGIEPAWDGGYFLFGEGSGQSIIWRYDVNDQLMPAFGGDGIAGEMNYIGGSISRMKVIGTPAGRRLSIAATDANRLDAVTGLRETTYGAFGNGLVPLDGTLSVLPGDDGSVIGIGQQGQSTSHVRRVSPTGTLEPWRDIPLTFARDILHAPAGKLTWMFPSTADEDVIVARLDWATNQLDPAFGNGGTSTISLSIPGETAGQYWPGFSASFVVPAPDGKLVIAGEYSSSLPNGGGEKHDVMFVRLND